MKPIKFQKLKRNWQKRHLFALGGTFLTFFSVVSYADKQCSEDKHCLNIATNDFTLDWHPIRVNTYPAQLLSRLTTEHLLEKVCIGDETTQIPRPDMTGLFLKVCLSNAADINDNNNYVDLRRIDQRRCPGLSVADLDFTLKQISRDSTNDYNYFKLERAGTDLLVNNPTEADATIIRQAISFPIIRANARYIANSRFGIGSEEDYNDLTHGHYQVKAFKANVVDLERNRNKRKWVNITDISLQFYPEREKLLEQMESRDVDVVLNLPTNINPDITGRNYRQHASSELNNVTYIGFNFRTQKPDLLELYNNKTFRRLFTVSVWATPVIQSKVNVSGRGKSDGIFYGEGFDPRSRQNTPLFLLNRDDDGQIMIKKKIQEFLRDNDINTRIPIRVLIHPSIYYLLTKGHIDELENQLTQMWTRWDNRRGLKFNFLNPVSPDKYTNHLNNGKGFEMLIDTLFFGENSYKAMYLLLKGDPLNRLNNGVISASNINRWLRQGPKGLESFRKRVLETYPVAIIGSFPRRDYISTRINLPKNRCPANSALIPYTSIQDWRKKK
jgi:hypothetical protein